MGCCLFCLGSLWQSSEAYVSLLQTMLLFIYFSIYLFIWLHRVLVAARGIFVVECGLLSSCGSRALERPGSVVVAHGLSCPAACGTLVP